MRHNNFMFAGTGTVLCPQHRTVPDLNNPPTNEGKVNQNVFSTIIIMAALRSRCGHYIFALWCLLLYGRPMDQGRPLYFHAVVCSFFSRLISGAAEWMSAILTHMVWP